MCVRRFAIRELCCCTRKSGSGTSPTQPIDNWPTSSARTRTCTRAIAPHEVSGPAVVFGWKALVYRLGIQCSMSNPQSFLAARPSIGYFTVPSRPLSPVSSLLFCTTHFTPLTAHHTTHLSPLTSQHTAPSTAQTPRPARTHHHLIIHLHLNITPPPAYLPPFRARIRIYTPSSSKCTIRTPRQARSAPARTHWQRSPTLIPIPIPNPISR
ncbi:hypothetical protein DENSPDRAFT_409227 [Dentipellis sp. KUC8613]|nr:hypothetical protein DENSPDRAFT_409227 [Dentipellis sp. KUC8613]